MATLLIHDPDYNVIQLAPEKIILPLPSSLIEKVDNDNKKKKSNKKDNIKKEEKKCIFGRAGITYSYYYYY